MQDLQSAILNALAGRVRKHDVLALCSWSLCWVQAAECAGGLICFNSQQGALQCCSALLCIKKCKQRRALQVQHCGMGPGP